MSSIDNYNYKNEIRYPMNAKALEDINCQENTDIKVYVPLLMPLINSDSVIENKKTINTSNIKNKSKVTAEGYTECNYIPVDIAQEHLYACPHDDDENIDSGQEFIVVCLNGELSDIRVIGRNY